jgi:putative nucleotidyltransferase with HDIG domain
MSDSLTLLVVDDEQEICSLLHDVLEVEGYKVEVCTDGRRAVNRIKDFEFDGVITDLKMPDVDGLTVAKAAKSRCEETATIVVTAYASLQTAIGALRTGVDDYICKPFDIDHIIDVVRRTLSVRLAEKRNKRLLDQLKHANSRNLMSSNASLTRRIGELSLLNDISKALANELHLDRLLTLALEIVSDKMGVRAAVALLFDEETQKLVVRACRGFEESSMGRSLPVGRGLAGTVAATRLPLLVEDITEEEEVTPADFEINGFTSVLGVPLMVKEDLVGVLLVCDKGSREKFTNDDSHVLMTIGSQMATAVENARLYAVLQDSTFRTVQALASSLEAKDNYTSGHSQRVTRYSLLIAEKLGLGKKDMENLRYASQLHDIGKIGITERILNKPDKLTEWEFAAIKDHPVIGERIINSLDFLDIVRDIIRHHHERWDGGGYPDNLSREEIPLLARVMAVADAYDAMTTARPYRSALTPEEAVEELKRCSETQFDPRLVEVFLEVLREQDPFSPDVEEMGSLL